MSVSTINFLSNIKVSKIKRINSSSLADANETETEKVNENISKLIVSLKNKDCKIIYRGEKKSILKKKYQSRLNSNDSLFDGLFLVGDKAKNYLEKSDNIPHPIKNINYNFEDTCNWIFDFYSKQFNIKNIDLNYFKIPSNKLNFVSTLIENPKLIESYLFGIHTIDSGFLVNYVSGTTKLTQAKLYSNDIIIIYWMNNNNLSMDKSILDKRASKLKKLKLPIISDSNHPDEDEVAIKGCLFPHYILGALDVTEDLFIPNPEILNCDYDWITNGFEINQENFEDFIMSTKYKRYLTLIDDNHIKEKSC